MRLDLSAPAAYSAGSPPAPAWVVALTSRVVSADLVQQAIVTGVLDAVVRAAPQGSADSPAPSLVLTSSPDSDTTDTSVGTGCHEHFFTLGGVQLYHWTVCTETTTIPGSSSSPPPPVHLEVEHHPKHHH